MNDKPVTSNHELGAPLASLGALIGDPSRARILVALLDGRSLPATELARRAGVTGQTASSHLTKLAEAELLMVIPQGRHRYYRLANSRVADLLETMATLAPLRKENSSLLKERTPLQKARTCYNHLAGHLGVSMTKAFVEQGVLKEVGRDYQLTKTGMKWFSQFEIDVESLRKTGRAFARQCLDWSERRNHLAGALGSAWCTRLFELNWLKRTRESRVVLITKLGQSELHHHLSLTLEKPQSE